jgi:drug/metabolite transporter (DMT)-like permease
MLCVSLSYAAANVYAKTIPFVEPSRMALGQQMISAFGATGLALLFGGVASYAPVTQSLPAMVGLSLISTAAPITIFMYMIRAQGPTRASMTGYLIPVFAYGLAILLLGEPLGLREVAGGTIALIGVYFVSTAQSRPRTAT